MNDDDDVIEEYNSDVCNAGSTWRKDLSNHFKIDECVKEKTILQITIEENNYAEGEYFDEYSFSADSGGSTNDEIRELIMRFIYIYIYLYTMISIWLITIHTGRFIIKQ